MSERESTLELLSDGWIQQQIELCQKTTPGPWAYDGQHNEIHCLAAEQHYFLIVSECRSAPDQEYAQDEFGHQYDANFDFMASAHKGYPLVLNEVQDLRASFALYSEAVRAGTELYREAHPELDELTDPDTAKMVAWLVAELQQLRNRRCGTCGFYIELAFGEWDCELRCGEGDRPTSDWFCGSWKSRRESDDASTE